MYFFVNVVYENGVYRVYCLIGKSIIISVVEGLCFYNGDVFFYVVLYGVGVVYVVYIKSRVSWSLFCKFCMLKGVLESLFFFR